MSAAPPSSPAPSSPPADRRRRVEVTRTGPLRLRATNSRGTTLDLGSGDSPDFTPVELLLVALAGCSAVDVDAITGKRSEPAQFDVVAEADKVRDGDGNHLTGMTLDFQVSFPDTDEGRAAEAVLARSVVMSHDRLRRRPRAARPAAAAGPGCRAPRSG
jgi:putative redox protein